jgi:pimeloyl-ACP methyl ester carboxylesterase
VSRRGLTPGVREWRGRGRSESFRDRRIHVFTRDGTGTPLVLLHGFPSSSYDWRHLLAVESERATLAFDFLGFGLSEKPRDHEYTLGWQADLAEALVDRHLGGGPVFLVAHDMGTSVATELLARDLEGTLGIELTGVLLFNGSIVIDRATLTRSQRLLRGPLGPLAASLANEWVFRREFAALFSPAHPLTDAEAADQWSLLAHDGGHRLGHRLIHYIDERVRYAERWHGAVRDWDGPLAFAWGLRDPVATVAVLEALLELRPHAPTDRFEDLGHYAQIEDPPAIAASLESALSRSTEAA